MAFLPKLPTGDYLPDQVLVFYIRLPTPLPLSQRSFIWEPPGAFDPLRGPIPLPGGYPCDSSSSTPMRQR